MSRKWLSLLLIAALAFSAVGLVAAQSDNTTDNAQRPLLGIAVVADEAGARVVTVMPGSPAANAGLQIGDIITTLNNEEVTAETLASTIQGLAVGDSVTLGALRGEENLELSATLGGADEAFNFGLRNMPFLQRFNQAYIGVQLQNTDDGVKIADVTAESPAAKAGLLVDDILVQINETTISTVRDAQTAVAALQSGDVANVTVKRGEDEVQVAVTIENAPLRQMDMRFGNRFGLSFDGTNWSINELAEDSALYTAGLRSGDGLNTINGEAFDPTAVMAAVDGAEDGASVTLNVTRDDETLDVDVPVTALTELFGNMMFRFDGSQLPPMFDGRGGRGNNGPFNFDFGQLLGGQARLGVAFIVLDEQTAQENNVDVTEGALLTEIQPDSPAAAANLQVGDIVTAVDGDKVDVERTLRDRLLAYEPGDVVTLSILREGESMDVEVTLDQSAMSSDLLPFLNGRQFRFNPNPNDQRAPETNQAQNGPKL